MRQEYAYITLRHKRWAFTVNVQFDFYVMVILNGHLEHEQDYISLAKQIYFCKWFVAIVSITFQRY